MPSNHPRPLIEVFGVADDPQPRRRQHTPPRSVRVPDHVWDAARARAQAEGTTVTAVILRALTRYAKGGKR